MSNIQPRLYEEKVERLFSQDNASYSPGCLIEYQAMLNDGVHLPEDIIYLPDAEQCLLESLNTQALNKLKAQIFLYKSKILNSIYSPEGDTCIVPKAETLLPIDKVQAKARGLIYYYLPHFTGCPKHNDVSIFSRHIPKGITANRDMCRSCIEERVQKKWAKQYPRGYWKTSPHKTEYTEIQFSVLNKRYLQRQAPSVTVRRRLADIFYFARQCSRDLHYSDLGYTPSDLRKRIESLFDHRHSWDNWGEWALDHIVPVAFLRDHNLMYPAIVNSLNNLQPLSSNANSKKGAKVLRKDVEALRENVLLPNGLDYQKDWEKDSRIINEPTWFNLHK